MGLQVPASHRSLFRGWDVLGSFNHTLTQNSTAIGHSLGTGRSQELASQTRRLQVRKMTQRFVLAILGGLIIVVPMLILVLGIYPPNNIAPRALAVISTSIFLCCSYRGVVFAYEARKPSRCHDRLCCCFGYTHG